MLPSSRPPNGHHWGPLVGPFHQSFHQLEQRLPHIQPLLLSAFDQVWVISRIGILDQPKTRKKNNIYLVQAVQAGRGQRQLPPMPSGPAGDFPKHRLPYLAGSLPGAVLPPPSLGHSPSRRIVEDDDEDWCWQDAQTKHNKSGKCQYRQNQSTALLCGKGIWTKMCWPVDLLSRLKNPSLTAFFIVNVVVKAYITSPSCD